MSTLSLNSKLLLSTAALIVGGWLGAGPALAQDKVLRAVMHADLRTLDPRPCVFGRTGGDLPKGGLDTGGFGPR